MRGMLNGEWYDLEEYGLYNSVFDLVLYIVKDDPERGTFEREDFEEFDARP